MFHEIKQRLEGWIRLRNDIQRLRAFDNYLLADVGIEREQIAARVKGRAAL